jgi:hypothetical protein
MPSLRNLLLAADSEGLKAHLASLGPETICLGDCENLPMDGPSRRPTLKILMDDPRFDFNSEFTTDMLYFSSVKMRQLIFSHPRCKKLLEKHGSFGNIFIAQYGYPTAKILGVVARHSHADHVYKGWKRQTNMKVAFALYPQLVQWSRHVIERYYAPGGGGALRAKASFQSRR